MNIYVAGIGGLGVLTIGSLLGSAAYFDGLSSSVLDLTGLSQKNGSVVSQVRIAGPAQPIHAVRIGDGDASGIARLSAELSQYQDSTYAGRFLALIDTARSATAAHGEKGSVLGARCSLPPLPRTRSRSWPRTVRRQAPRQSSG